MVGMATDPMRSTQDTETAREERYLLAVYDTAIDVADPDERDQILAAVLAVADQEQAELRAERDAALASIERVGAFATHNALVCRATGRADLERQWLNLLAILELAALADPEGGA